MDICHMEGKKLCYFYELSILIHSFQKARQRSSRARSAYDSDTGDFRTAVYTYTYLCDVLQQNASVYIPLPLDAPPYQTLLQFSPRRTYGRMSVRGDSTRHRRSPLPSTVSTHRRTFFIHALYVVKQYAIVLVAVTLRLHQTDIHAVCTLVSKVSSDRGGTRSSVGKNHNTRIPPSARITADKCPFNISSGSLRARCSSRSMLENHHRSRA